MSIARQSWIRTRFSVISYFRSPDSVFFTFLFPIIMLGIFTAAFSAEGNIGQTATTPGVSVGAYYLPGMVAAGVLLSGVQNLAMQIALEKSNGTLKRLGGTPLSPVAYFAGKIGQVFATAILQTALLLLVARVVFGIQLPTDASKWGTFVWVYVLGLIASALLGIALSAVPRSGESATAVVVPLTLILQFISGVYLQFTLLPTWMQDIASVFPLKWLAQAMRSVFLPGYFEQAEAGHSWNLGGTALMLSVWLVAGLVLCLLTFRWVRRDQ